MALEKASKRAGMALTVLLVFVFCGPATAQDLPPDILADQYMVEGVNALETGEGKQAIKTFRRIEALDTDPPAMFPFFYGKALVENSTVFDDLLKGQSLLQQFKVDTGSHSQHYNTALRLLLDVGRKLLPAAVAQGRAKAVRALIASGANVNARNEKGCTTLCIAVQEGHSEIVQVLINAGADISSLEKEDGRETIEAFRQMEALGTALPVEFQFLYGKALIRHSDVSHAEDLLKGQSLIKQFVIDTGRDSEHYTAALRLLSVAGRRLLFAAVANGQAEAVRAFIDAGAAVNAKDDSGGTLLRKALHKAIGEVPADLAQAILDAVDSMAGKVAGTPLHVAALAGHAEVVQLLIAAGAAVDTWDREAGTPLFWAALAGHAEVAQVLIDAGAAVDVRDKDVPTPLLLAALAGHAEVAQVLIDAGADVNAKSKGGATPLDVASFKEHAEVVRALKLAGATGTVRH